MSTVELPSSDPLPVQSTKRSTGWGLPGLRGTGLVGHVSAAVLVLAVSIAAFGTMVAPHDPDRTNLSFQFVGRYQDHYLGFDSQGRDIFSRLLVGARSSLLGPIAVVALSMVIGTAIAVATAWKGGRFDRFVSAGLDVLFAFPAIVLAILVSVVIEPGLKAATIALAIAYTPYIARVLRSAALRERSRDYIAALEVQGLRATVICVRHLGRNLLPLIVAQGAVLFGYAMVDLAAISFLGLGVQPPQADWGVMVSTGQSGVLQGYPMESLSAGICIVAVVVAVNLLGERLTERAQLVTR
jgi:peptide/nickel transport system permease protein